MTLKRIIKIICQVLLTALFFYLYDVISAENVNSEADNIILNTSIYNSYYISDYYFDVWSIQVPEYSTCIYCTDDDTVEVEYSKLKIKMFKNRKENVEDTQ